MLAIDPAQYRLVDLSVEIEPPGSEERPLEVSVGRLADDTYKMDISKLHSHVGTHVEAPYHFFGSGKLITDMPLESFFGPAALLSVDDPADSEVTGETLDREIGDIFAPGHILLCRNGLEETRDNPADFPYLTPDAARWMVARQMKLLVIDACFGLGPDIPATRELHEILMSRDICIVEFVILDGLRRRECFFMCLPVAFALDSSFARAIAFEES